MTNIDESTVEHLANLARIDLTDKEIKKFTKQVSSILDFFSELSELDTEDVKPTYHVLEINNVFRDDVAKDSLPREEILANAPEKEKGYFKAPKIIND
jgi:aspartyl-tRNA(Asn)/glutamyl-tRNA(Gln) amidotransferase subunit C